MSVTKAQRATIEIATRSYTIYRFAPVIKLGARKTEYAEIFSAQNPDGTPICFRITACNKMGKTTGIPYDLNVKSLAEAIHFLGYKTETEVRTTPGKKSGESLVSAKCRQLADLLTRKNTDYGNSIFEPTGPVYDEPPERRIYSRMNDKVCRLKTLLANQEPSQVAESIDDTLFDLAGYCMLALVAREKGKDNE